jgi:hypothetical protein
MDPLDELEFIWRVDLTVINDKQWYLHCERLVEFKRENGHCNVPRTFEQNKSFANGVNTQRASHATDKIRQDRKDLLDEVEFVCRLESPRLHAPAMMQVSRLVCLFRRLLRRAFRTFSHVCCINC